MIIWKASPTEKGKVVEAKEIGVPLCNEVFGSRASSAKSGLPFSTTRAAELVKRRLTISNRVERAETEVTGLAGQRDGSDTPPSAAAVPNTTAREDPALVAKPENPATVIAPPKAMPRWKKRLESSSSASNDSFAQGQEEWAKIVEDPASARDPAGLPRRSPLAASSLKAPERTPGGRSRRSREYAGTLVLSPSTLW